MYKRCNRGRSIGFLAAAAVADKYIHVYVGEKLKFESRMSGVVGVTRARRRAAAHAGITLRAGRRQESCAACVWTYTLHLESSCAAG